MRKKKFNEEIYQRVKLSNSKENPFDISEYDRESIKEWHGREGNRSKKLYITFVCAHCNKSTVKNIDHHLESRYTDKTFVNCEDCNRDINNMAKYGCINSFSREDVKEKIKQTNIKKYGVDNPAKSRKIQNKIKKTNQNKYGCVCVFQNNDIIEKMADTKLSKYGTLNLGHFHYRYDGIYFDSSWEIAFWIYHKDKKHNIIHEPTSFEYYANNRKYHYIPDFKIGNRYYEIKGEQFITRYKNGKIKCLTEPFGEISEKSKAKYKCLKYNKVKIITKNEITKYLLYVDKHYSLDYNKFKLNDNINIEEEEE